MTKVLHHLDKRHRERAAGSAPARNRVRLASTIAVFFITAGLAVKLLGSAAGEAEDVATAKVTDCDRLAAHPSDPQKLAPGVEQKEVDVPRAKAACLKAFAANPTDGRTLYQLGRTYFYGGEFDPALDYFRRSDAAGYAEGQFVLGLVLVQGNGVEPDLCAGGASWVKAARQRHVYAKIYLVNNWLDGLFAGCDLGITEQEMDGMVSAAEEMAETPRQKDDVTTLRANWSARKR